MTTESIKVEAVENEKVIIDEKDGFHPIKFVKDKIGNIPAVVKYVGAAIAGAVVVTAVGAAVVNRHNLDELDEVDDDLVIEDFEDSDPAEMVEAEE